MKWIQFLVIIFWLPGLPLFQMDQAIDTNWLICDNSLVIKLEYSDIYTEKCFWFDSISIFSLFNQMRFTFQVKNPLSLLFSYLRGTSPFWRPPPSFHPSLS